MQNELENMRRENQNLQLSLQRYTGDDLSFTQYEDTVALEKQLESALQKVRSQKVYILFILFTISQSPLLDFGQEF